MENDNTWIKFYRKSLDSQVFNNEGLWKLWTWCLLKASYEERWVSVKVGAGEIEVKLLPGQFIFGRLSAAKKLRQKPSTVRNRMQKLQNMGNVDIQEGTHYSIVTICNWEEYQKRPEEEGQPIGQPEDSQGTTIGQPEDTNKKVEKVKKVKEPLSPAPTSGTAPPTPQEFLTAWNEICGEQGLPKIEKLSAGRITKIKARLKTYPTDEFWEEVLNKIPHSKFLTGTRDVEGHQWRATFDWLFKNDENPLRVKEGVYDK